jgi:hypothetical protein
VVLQLEQCVGSDGVCVCVWGGGVQMAMVPFKAKEVVAGRRAPLLRCEALRETHMFYMLTGRT